ncbi:hypothetical protein TR80_014460 [Xanthomonas campestris]|nr:hypothetical protein TR80_014460 [Xanthomonas campestris]
MPRKVPRRWAGKGPTAKQQTSCSTLDLTALRTCNVHPDGGRARALQPSSRPAAPHLIYPHYRTCSVRPDGGRTRTLQPSRRSAALR